MNHIPSFVCLTMVFFRYTETHRVSKSGSLDFGEAAEILDSIGAIGVSENAQKGYGDCFYKDYTHVEIDSMFERQRAKSAQLCQSKCAETSACLHFTWWSDGGCHLHGPRAVRIPVPGMGTVSGPKRCPSCIIKSAKYVPLNMPGGPGRLTAESQWACQILCQKTVGCKRFTWFVDHGCHLADSSSSLVPDPNAQAGPPTCVTQEMVEKAKKRERDNLIQKCMRETMSKECCVFDKAVGKAKYKEYGADACQVMSSLTGSRAFARCPLGLKPYVFKKINSNFDFKAKSYSSIKKIDGYVWFSLQGCDQNKYGNYGCQCALSKLDAETPGIMEVEED